MLDILTNRSEIQQVAYDLTFAVRGKQVSKVKSNRNLNELCGGIVVFVD